MSEATVDYARFGRQIALPELGADGQRGLAAVAVRFEPASELLRETHERAGGRVTADADVVVEVPAGPARPLAAWASVEAARRVLGETPKAFPVGLRERLGA